MTMTNLDMYAAKVDSHIADVKAVLKIANWVLPPLGAVNPEGTLAVAFNSALAGDQWNILASKSRDEPWNKVAVIANIFDRPSTNIAAEILAFQVRAPSVNQKFRVHCFQVHRVSYDVQAETAVLAEKMVRDDPDNFSPSSVEATEEWLPEATVDPLLPNGEVDYDNVKNIDIRSAMDLRREALGLLKMAEKLDGLEPHLVMHSHEYGVTTYMGWSPEDLSEQGAVWLLDSQFEPDKDESLVVDCSLSLEDLTGVWPSSLVPAGLEEAKKIGSQKNSCDRADCTDGEQYEGKIMDVLDNYVVHKVLAAMR